MTDNIKNESFERLYDLYNSGAISEDDYHAIVNGLNYVETPKERDATLEQLWETFSETRVDSGAGCIEEPFLGFPAGTEYRTVCEWFNERHSKGVAYLMFHSED